MRSEDLILDFKRIKKAPAFGRCFMYEVESGFEPLYEVLQTSA